jgi:hypothetical protein
VRLTPRAFRLLSHLIEQRPRAVSKRDLLTHVWSGNIVDEANLKTLVLEIRSALENRGGKPEAIRTVYGYGYAFAGEAVDAVATSGPVVRLLLPDRIVSLPAGVHEIGRRADCAVSIDAASVSRVHARLHAARDTLLLDDAGSKNGTFVDGQRIAAATPLPARSTVRIGDVEVTIERIGGALAETATLDPAP